VHILTFCFSDLNVVYGLIFTISFMLYEEPRLSVVSLSFVTISFFCVTLNCDNSHVQ